MAARKNPIERRLALVSDQWTEFAELPDARLLCWRARHDEYAMVDAFVGSEADEAGTLPDLFVRLVSPFDPQEAYGFTLCAELSKQAEALHEGLDDPTVPPWTPPAWQRGERDASLFVRTCDSFSQHYNLPAHLAVYLSPKSVGDAHAFQIWLQQAIALAPPNVRFIVVDDVKAPALGPLVRAEPARVAVRPLDLDMPAAKVEISQEAGNLDTPGGKFRHLFVKLTNALGEGDVDLAMNLGQAALAIAAAQGWFALAVPVHFALGAALAGLGRNHEANERYMSAEIASTEGEKAGDPVCTKLRAQSRMARGGLLVNMRAYNLAGQLFAETVPLAKAANDPRMVIDCYRLASFSYEQDGQRQKAWQNGLDGLGFAAPLDKETVETSTLSYLVEGLMRLAKHPDYSASSLRIEREIVRLLGRKDWRPTAHLPPSAQRNGAPS